MTEENSTFVENVTEDFKERTKEGKRYVVHTYSGRGGKIKVNIEKMVENCGYIDDIFGVIVSIEEYVSEVGGAEKLKERRISPGYVLVRMTVTDVSWYLVKNIRSVTEFVGPESKPAAVSEKEIQKFALKNQFYSEKEIDVNVGDNVNIVSRTLNDQVDIIGGISTKKAICKAPTFLFGRDTSIEISFDDVGEV